MPRNAANKDVLPIYAGRTLKFFVLNSRRIAASLRVFNPSFDTDLQVKVQCSANGSDERQRIVLTGTTLTGQFSVAFGGQTTGPITFNSTGSTMLTNFVAGLLLLSQRLGSTTNLFRAVQSSTTANGSTLDFAFIGSLGKNPRDLVTVSLTPSGGTPLTGGSPAAAITRQAAGTAPGSSTPADITPDGRAAATATVKPRGSSILAFGVDSDSDNLVGPFIDIVGVAGQGEIQADWDDTHVQQRII